MDVRRFPTEPGWRVGKIAATMKPLVCSVEEGHFFWLLFLIRVYGARPFGAGFAVRALCAQWASKEKSPAASAAEAFVFGCQEARASALRRGAFFVLPKKVPKERRFPDKATYRVRFAGIFRLAILARSENGGDPWPPPYGLGDMLVDSLARKIKGKQQK